MILPIITCMGRLAHLKQTLPAVVGEFGRAVLVDWSCPDRSGEWATNALGAAVEVVSVPGHKSFHKTRALNAGIRRAGELMADWLLILDADTRIEHGLRAACEERARPGQFAIGDRMWPGPRWRQHLGGVLLVARADMDRVGGYDESFQDYGPEDVEMRCRLRLRGNVRCVDLPTALLDSLPHSDSLRMEHATRRDLSRSAWENGKVLANRVRSWTGKDLESVSEIRDLLIGPGCRMIVPVVVCRGDSDCLRRTLSLLVSEFGHAVLVAGSSNDHDGDWAERTFGAAVSVVRVEGDLLGDRVWSPGARRATELAADWLLFLETGVEVERGLRIACEERAVQGQFVVGGKLEEPGQPDPHGLLLVSAIDFARAVVPDAAFGDGLENGSLASRLALRARCRAVELPQAFARRVPGSVDPERPPDRDDGGQRRGHDSRPSLFPRATVRGRHVARQIQWVRSRSER